MTHKKRYLLPIFFIVLMYLDGCISFIFQQYLFHGAAGMPPRLILLGLIMTLFFLPETKYIEFIAMGIGFIFDGYFFGIFGIYTFIFPGMVFLAKRSVHYFEPNFIIVGLYYLVTLTVFESISYVYNVFIGSTNFVVADFIAENLGPTLILNMVIYAVLYYPISKLLKKLKN